MMSRGGEMGYNHARAKVCENGGSKSMTISLTFSLPPDVEERVRTEIPDLTGAVREAFVVDLFRRGFLTHQGLSRSLGLDRFETDALLKRHRVTEQSLNHEEVDADVRNLDELLTSRRP